jgi:hypothetical protein
VVADKANAIETFLLEVDVLRIMPTDEMLILVSSIVIE